MTGYLAPEGYVSELLAELSTYKKVKVEKVYERLILTSGPLVPAAWSQNTWINPREIAFESITQAATALKALQRNWALYSVQSHRRAALIEAKLPKVSRKVLEFPIGALPTAPMGSWTLLENNLLLASPHCSSPFPDGEVHFTENKSGPPSRAYLKLWEALTLSGVAPGPGERCLDMGSSPGGWTWVLQQLGAEVVSVDKAPLAIEIASLPRIEFLRRDAFGLDPKEMGSVDWFFSDVICYPQKLLELVQKWLKAGKCGKFVCTIKFQGDKLSDEDRAAVRGLAEIPNSSVRHLFHNKHELTWTKLK